MNLVWLDLLVVVVVFIVVVFDDATESDSKVTALLFAGEADTAFWDLISTDENSWNNLVGPENDDTLHFNATKNKILSNKSSINWFKINKLSLSELNSS